MSLIADGFVFGVQLALFGIGLMVGAGLIVAGLVVASWIASAVWDRLT